ncbi:MAG: response regulator transcription factor [Actinomycetota bacterium]
MIRVILADDQELIRAGFKVLIDSAADLTVVGEAQDGQAAIDLVRSERADVVLMDIRMPGLDGLAATREICADDDLAGVRVIILTTFELDDYVLRAVRAGASGFLGKGVSPDDLLAAIRTVAAGDGLLSPVATRAVLDRLADGGDGAELDTEMLADLTEREREMTALAAHGLSNDEIAARAFLSPLTVKTHLNRAMMKVGARDRAQLVVLAFRSGLVKPGDQLEPHEGS